VARYPLDLTMSFLPPRSSATDAAGNPHPNFATVQANVVAQSQGALPTAATPPAGASIPSLYRAYYHLPLLLKYAVIIVGLVFGVVIVLSVGFSVLILLLSGLGWGFVGNVLMLALIPNVLLGLVTLAVAGCIALMCSRSLFIEVSEIGLTQCFSVPGMPQMAIAKQTLEWLTVRNMETYTVAGKRFLRAGTLGVDKPFYAPLCVLADERALWNAMRQIAPASAQAVQRCVAQALG